MADLLSPAILNRIPAMPTDGDGAPPHPPKSLRASFAIACASTRTHAKSFYFASHFLPKQRKFPAYAVYAYCRYIDDLIDEASERDRLPDIAELRAQNRLLIQGKSEEGFAPAFAWTCEQCKIPLVLLDELVEGCCRDREEVRLQTFSELEEYCYLVASVVGLMMCRVFGVNRPEAYPRAVEMGVAMQLTNILRDIAEDWQRGRVYLPADELHNAGIDLKDILLRDGYQSDAWCDFMKNQVDRARNWYRSARTGLPYIQNKGARRTATVMSSVYGGILDELEKADYDPTRRHYVPFFRKCRLAFRNA